MSTHHVATIDVVALRNNVPGVGSRQECRHCGLLGGCPKATCRNCRGYAALDLAGRQPLGRAELGIHHVPHGRINDPRSDGIDVDAVVDQIEW